MYEEIGKKLKHKFSEKISERYHLERDSDLKGETPDFAQAIKKIRQDLGFSLEKVSEMTGINKQTLHSIENYSIKNPSFANLERIAAAFKTDLNDLLLMARSEYAGNLFKTTAGERWNLSFEAEKGFSIHAYSPPSATQRDFFIGVISMQGKKKLKHWSFARHSKLCIQPWDGDVLFVYHGMNWRKESHVLANETLYFDGGIPHTFENLSENSNRMLIVTHPSIF